MNGSQALAQNGVIVCDWEYRLQGLDGNVSHEADPVSAALSVLAACKDDIVDFLEMRAKHEETGEPLSEWIKVSTLVPMARVSDFDLH